MDTRELLARLLDEAIVLPRTEIARALIEPHRALVTLLHNRSADLRALDELVDELAGENFGIF